MKELRKQTHQTGGQKENDITAAIKATKTQKHVTYIKIYLAILSQCLSIKKL